MSKRRALLYVPGDDLHKIQKAAGLNVDAIILDMEDGVALNRKDAAREIIARVLKESNFGTSEKLVRVNPLEDSRGEKDIQQILPSHPDGIVVPKVNSPEVLLQADRWLAEEEARQGWVEKSILLLAIIESAQAFLNLKDICSCTDRLKGLIFGGEDLAADIGATRTREAVELLFARSSLVMHAAAYGLQAIDMVTVEFKDLDILKQDARAGAQMGYTGKQVIHPAQVDAVQEAFTPSPAELRAAQELVAAFEIHQKEGKGAFAFEGKMVDMPVIRRARNVIERGL